jgi:hypothetical protein
MFITIHGGISNVTELGSIHTLKNVVIHPDFQIKSVRRKEYHNDIALAIVCN